MRPRLIWAAATMMMVITVMGPASAQESDTLQLRIEGIDTANHPDITMVVSVPPEMIGKSLTSEDFAVTEDGEIRPTIATPIPTDGLQVVLLLDASGSMGGRPIVAAKEAALGFLDAMPDGVEVAVVSFADKPIVLSAFTTDEGVTAVAISDLRLGKNTALYDGLAAGAAMFVGEDGAQRTLVLLSDGGDTASETSLEEAIISLLDADVNFFAVELQSPEYDSEALTRLGVASDGVLVSAEDPEALTAVFAEVASQIVNRYELRYESAAYGANTVAVKAEVDGATAVANEEVLYPAPPPVVAEPEPSPTVAVAEEAIAVPALRSGTIVVLNWWESTAAFWLGVALVFLGLASLLIFTGVGQRSKDPAIQTEKESRFGKSKGRTLSSVTQQATMFAERTVNRGDSSAGPVTRLLESAGIQLRPGEMIVMSLAVALVVMAVSLVLWGPAWALLLGVLTLILIRAWIGQKAKRRERAFADQLVDVLQLMSGSIRSGFGLMQAMNTVAQEVSAPAGEEFQRVKIETQLGRDTNDALTAMAARVGNEDFKWVVEAIEIHREVGGDLADILDSVMDTVRDRNRVRRQIRSLSAEGRVSGLVLAILPFGIAAAMAVMNPGYLSPLFTTQIGRMLTAFGLVLMFVGVIWMQRVTSLKY
ncbi:MAG: type II secretion system F family protein [Actinomycetia bacterium]|nr:type II secretion system F family protein [Actinomycetes bacterium]